MSTRRVFIGLIAALAGVSHAQRGARTIGLIVPWTEAAAKEVQAGLMQELLALGYVRSGLDIVLRTADSINDRLPALAEELIKLKVDLIVAASTNAVTAVRRASASIPIVFFVVADPVASGLADSLARPGRNNTGLTNFSNGELSTKRGELAKRLIPDLVRTALLTNPSTWTGGSAEQVAQDARERFGFQQIVVGASSIKELEGAFQKVAAFRAQLVFVQIDAYFGDIRSQIVELLLRNRLASVFADDEMVEAGGLMSYGADDEDSLRRVASYVDKIFEGRTSQ